MSDFNIETEIALLKAEAKTARKAGERILKILEGNGHPEDGLVTSHSMLKQSVKRLWWFVTWIPTGLGVITGIIFGVIKFII